jgi:hypothetical protein
MYFSPSGKFNGLWWNLVFTVEKEIPWK